MCVAGRRVPLGIVLVRVYGQLISDRTSAALNPDSELIVIVSFAAERRWFPRCHAETPIRSHADTFSSYPIVPYRSLSIPEILRRRLVNAFNISEGIAMFTGRKIDHSDVEETLETLTTAQLERAAKYCHLKFKFRVE